MIDIDKSKIPSDAKEGDVLNIDGDLITINIKETTSRRKLIEELTKDLWS